jgi:hypothetical protein
MRRTRVADSHAKSAKEDRFTVASHAFGSNERTRRTIACDVHVSGNDRRERRRGHCNVGGKLRRYSGEVHAGRRAASTAADAVQIFLGTIHHEGRQEV